MRQESYFFKTVKVKLKANSLESILIDQKNFTKGWSNETPNLLPYY
jgi:hypothetical protein